MTHDVDDGLKSRYTTGPWVTEAESVAAFDQAVEDVGMFRSYTEVQGHYVQPRIGQPLCTPRIDRILVPTGELIGQGWHHGPVGVECKRSGEKIGPPIAQMVDYSRAVWEIRRGIWIMVQWVFLWPMDIPHGPIASILAQQRLGNVQTTATERLMFHSGQQLIGRFCRDGTIDIRPGTSGCKAGSR